MKILFITHHYLSQPAGGSFASRAFANAFAQIATECVLLYPDNGEEIATYIDPKYKLIGVRYDKNKALKLIDIYLGRLNRFQEASDKQLKDFAPDLVVFDNSRTTSGLIARVKKLGIKTVTIHHNYEIEYYKGTPPSRLYRGAFMHHLKSTERNAVLSSDLNLTLTLDDIQLLREAYDKGNQANFEHIGCFESQKNERYPLIEIKNKQLVFAITGNLSAVQTETSLIPFINNYMEVINNHYPDNTVLIAGRDPSEKIRNYCSKYANIKLIPNPEDMNIILLSADIYICPINVGGGLKLRVMDGLKLGLPVITHEVSARGYEAFIEQGCLFKYDTLPNFESALLKATNTLNRIPKTSIQNYYREIFSFKSGTSRLKSALQQFKLIS